jgi:hypothetical protein
MKDKGAALNEVFETHAVRSMELFPSLVASALSKKGDEARRAAQSPRGNTGMRKLIYRDGKEARGS